MDRKRWMRGLIIVVAAVFLVTGCDSLRKKFTRVKKSSASQEPMVITPRDYSAHPFPNDVLYRQYFTYWKAWGQELVASLEDRASHKKIVDCADQCLLNLRKMKGYLNDEQAVKLDVFIEKTNRLRRDMDAAMSMLPSQYDGFRYEAERLYSGINREFDGRKMKDAIRPSAPEGSAVPS